EAEVVHRQRHVAGGHLAILIDVTRRADVDAALTAEDADHARDLAAEHDAVGVAVTAALAEAVETGLAHTAAFELAVARPRRHAHHRLALGALGAVLVGDTGRQRRRRDRRRRQVAADAVDAEQAGRALLVVFARNGRG